MSDMGGSSPLWGDATLAQVILGGARQQSEQAMGRKLVSSMPMASASDPASRFLPLNSLYGVMCKPNKPFPSVIVFITEIET